MSKPLYDKDLDPNKEVKASTIKLVSKNSLMKAFIAAWFGIKF